MLSIYMGSNYIFMEDKLSKVSDYFDAVYDVSWFQSYMAKKIIKVVDDSDYIEDEYIKSPVLGGMSPRDLSSGCKALLILLNEPDKIVNGDRMGDNCYPLLFEMAKTNDYTITLSHYIDFFEVGFSEVRNARTGKIISTPKQFMIEYFAEDAREE